MEGTSSISWKCVIFSDVALCVCLCVCVCVCVCHQFLTYGLEQSLSLEATNHLAIQEIPLNFSNQKVHYRVHKSPPLVRILREINPVYTSPPYFPK
jgi:hypothetical protein